MSAPLDPFSDAEEARIYEIARDVLSRAIRRALKQVAYDDLDALFGIEPSERQRRRDNPGRRSPGAGESVVNEQTIAAPLTNDQAEHNE